MSRRAEGRNLLDMAPVRRASWREAGDRVVIVRPAPRRSWWRAPRERFLYLITLPRLRLDSVGSFAWKRIDGHRTVGELAGELRRQFGETVEPAEERLGELVRLLRREGLIAYPGGDGEAGC